MDSDTKNQHSDSASNQQKKPLLKREGNYLNIIVFFQWDKRNRNATETNQIFPPHVFNVPFSQYLLQSILPVCFTRLLSRDVCGRLLGRLAHSMHLFHSSLHFCLFLNTVTEKTAVCCPHNPEKLHRFYQVVCYRTLLTALQVSVSRVEPPTAFSKTLLHNLCPSGLSMEAKSLLSILN